MQSVAVQLSCQFFPVVATRPQITSLVGLDDLLYSSIQLLSLCGTFSFGGRTVLDKVVLLTTLVACSLLSSRFCTILPDMTELPTVVATDSVGSCARVHGVSRPSEYDAGSYASVGTRCRRERCL